MKGFSHQHPRADKRLYPIKHFLGKAGGRRQAGARQPDAGDKTLVAVSLIKNVPWRGGCHPSPQQRVQRMRVIHNGD